MFVVTGNLHTLFYTLVPANIELSGFEVFLSNVMSREMILKEYAEQIRDQYDYILIDCIYLQY